MHLLGIWPLSKLLMLGGLHVSSVSECNSKQQLQSFHGAIMAVSQFADAPLAVLGGAAGFCPPCHTTGSLLPPWTGDNEV